MTVKPEEKVSLHGFSEADQRRIKNLANQLVIGQIENGTLDPEDEAALRKATRQALIDAKQTMGAVNDYLCH